MVTVKDLSKNYGQHTVLCDLSFHIKKGEIIALLGPNGAGKSTLLKILSGYLLPSSGSITIDEMNLTTHAREVSTRLGYLPEHTPLYLEMSVEEYIRYRAGLKKVRHRRIAEKVMDVLDLCGLRSVEHQLIEKLSKGYRQRVGLADALVNEPDLLLLDEPTIGLDFKQQAEIRTLMTTLAKRHTLLFSTHLLQEAAMIAHRFLILHHGKIVAFGTLEELRDFCSMPQATLEKIFVALTNREEH